MVRQFLDFLCQDGILTGLFVLLAINLMTFFVYGIDKWKARRAKWRISEATLLLLAVIGGSIGAWCGMRVWCHKTMHKKFRYGIPLIMAAQIALLFFTSCKTKQQVAQITPVENENLQMHSPSVLIIMYDKEKGKEFLLKAVKGYGAEVIYDYSIIPGMAIRKPDDKTLEETMQHFKSVDGVVSVEYDHIYRMNND